MCMQYIVDIPYRNKLYCKEIGLRLNKIESIIMLALCLNEKKRKIVFYCELESEGIDDIVEIKRKMQNCFSISDGKQFWEIIRPSEWVVYTVIEGMEIVNKYMIQKLLNDM